MHEPNIIGEPSLTTPFNVTIRPPTVWEMDTCGALVRDNWGEESYQRFFDQYVEYVQAVSQYAPQFQVATLGLDTIIGFSALRRSMLMNGFWEFIWIAVHKDHQGKGVGDMLTEHRLDIVRKHGGNAVLLVTQKPKYFNRFGFITSQHHGNDWVQMTCQLKLADMSK
jgi:N-acetylglutamate synthase-like GNAT family acetyltransferase